MEPEITSQIQDDLLILRTKGFIDDWKPISIRIYDAIEKTRCSRVVIDHRQLDFPTDLWQYAELEKFYEDKMPGGIWNLRISVVVTKKHEEAASFWATYCHNRGFNFSAFTTVESALAWHGKEELLNTSR